MPPHAPTLKNIPSQLIAHHVAPHLSTREAARLNAAVPGLHHELGPAMRTIHERRMTGSRTHLGKAVTRIADRIIAVLRQTATSPLGTEKTFDEGRMHIIVWRSMPGEGWDVTFVDTKSREVMGSMKFRDPKTEETSTEKYRDKGHLTVYVRDIRKLTVPEKARRGLFVAIMKDILEKLHGKPVESLDDRHYFHINRVVNSGKSAMIISIWPFFKVSHPLHA